MEIRLKPIEKKPTEVSIRIPITQDLHDELIDIKELARMTNFSIHTFYEMISEKRLPFPVYKFGRAVRFKRSDVLKWIDSKKVEIA